jgi:hypothetical protein
MTTIRIQGTVRLWFDDRGFIFIKANDGTDVLLHARESAGCGIPMNSRQSRDAGSVPSQFAMSENRTSRGKIPERHDVLRLLT